MWWANFLRLDQLQVASPLPPRPHGASLPLRLPLLLWLPLQAPLAPLNLPEASLRTLARPQQHPPRIQWLQMTRHLLLPPLRLPHQMLEQLQQVAG
eukprot:COSAG02_NODE_38663_length_426_cov_1.250765_1_plen_95_part_10